MTIERLRFLYGYEFWANRRILESLAKAKNRGEGVKLFGHILAAQKVWLARLRGEDSSTMQIWPHITIEECAAELERLAADFDRLWDSVDEEWVGRELLYQTQDGTEYRHKPGDLLTHVNLHGQHHRGQITWELRRYGQDAVSTDLIFYLRL